MPSVPLDAKKRRWSRRRRSQTHPRSRAPPRPRRLRQSPPTAFCPTATPVRLSRPTSRSTGCASPASTRRACSARCSIAARAASVSVLARASHTHRLVITHGNGPTVGLLALMSDAYTETSRTPRRLGRRDGADSAHSRRARAHGSAARGWRASATAAVGPTGAARGSREDARRVECGSWPARWSLPDRCWPARLASTSLAR